MKGGAPANSHEKNRQIGFVPICIFFNRNVETPKQESFSECQTHMQQTALKIVLEKR
jgi:hypothetical protein